MAHIPSSTLHSDTIRDAATHDTRDAWTEAELEQYRYYHIKGAEYSAVQGDRARLVTPEVFYGRS